MRHNEGYHRPRRAWQPTQRQREVLDALADGKTNAEIAVRLGISVDGAKWHVDELLAQTGRPDRQALASWWRETKREKPQAWFIPTALGLKTALALSTLVAAGVGVLLVTASGGSQAGRPAVVSAPSVPERRALPSYTPVVAPSPTPWPEAAVDALAKQDEPPSTCQPPQRLDLGIVSANDLREQGLVDLGRVVFVGHCPLYVANRADRAVVWMGGGGYVKADFSRGRGTGPCCRNGYFHSDGQTYSLDFFASYDHSPGGSRGLLWHDRDLVKVQMGLDNGPFVMLELREWFESGVASAYPGPGHRVALASDGRLFIDPSSLAGSLATNWLTGEAIDVMGMTQIGSLPLVNGRAIRNDCYEAELCSVQYDNGLVIPSPLAGTLRCAKDQRGDDEFVLEADGLRLELEAGGGHPFDTDCEDRPIRAGEPLPRAEYLGIEAYKPDGTPISLVVTRDGRLYVGDVKLKLACPCEPRS